MTFHFIFIKTRSIFRFLVPNRIVKIRNKQYSYDYQAEADLLRRDWESALERHSDRHPITYNRCMWMTTSHARKVMNLSKKHIWLCYSIWWLSIITAISYCFYLKTTVGKQEEQSIRHILEEKETFWKTIKESSTAIRGKEKVSKSTECLHCLHFEKSVQLCSVALWASYTPRSPSKASYTNDFASRDNTRSGLEYESINFISIKSISRYNGLIKLIWPYYS